MCIPYLPAFVLACFAFSFGTVFGACLVSWHVERIQEKARARRVKAVAEIERKTRHRRLDEWC